MPKSTTPSSDSVQSVVLALRIVEYLVSQRETAGVTELAQALGTTKSRVHRYLRTLVGEGFVEQVPQTERYKTGRRLSAMGHQAADLVDLATAANTAVRSLRDELGHFTVVSELEAGGLRAMATLPGKSIIEIGVKSGSVLGYHFTAQGKIALAFGDPDLRSRVLRSRMEIWTPHTIVSAVALEHELDSVRRKGYATAANEAVIGVNGLAAPVFDRTGRLVATIAIVDSIQFIAAEPSQTQVHEVLATARRMSSELGFQGPYPPA